ncbi:DNA topoisomerase IB [Yoonia litorea]|uniref:DNA topoisomerase n=1 Tax=Yoonia litorea TaxID=1123755 RepID=A0A1I6N058_9RHOB|nr:DNA topoisomerase IB [Yoonia litorea]SFS21329.1 DNA topoisomerase-1 [Yoonia litorea]
MTLDGLIYYPDSKPGYSRRRCGRGFTYLAKDGTIIRDQALRARLAGLAVPPAYADVWYSPHPHAHLLATGRDDKGRKQYLYHPDWQAAQAQAKYESLIDFGRALPRLRRRVVRDLNEDVGERAFALAAAVRLIDRTAVRVGTPSYADENGTFGALTLRPRHVQLEDNQILLDFPGKGGQQITHQVTDAKLAETLEEIGDLPGVELFAWTDTTGAPQRLSSEALNRYLADATDLTDVTAKTFRTWAGTCAAFDVARQGGATIAAMATAAADVLCNTPTIAKESYIHPDVLDLRGKDAPHIDPIELSGLKVTEQLLLGFLEARG